MPSKYEIRDQQGLYFVTFATVQWIDALSRPHYKDVIIESLRYCQKEKGLVLYAHVIMNNHIHLIVSSNQGNNLSNILRDLKKHTSKTLLAMIKNDSKESRKDWMMWLFKSAGKRNSNNKYYQFWQQDNRPIQLVTNEMMDQRLDYIHNNPVAAGIVYGPEHYIYSSALDYYGGKGLLELEFIS